MLSEKVLNLISKFVEILPAASVYQFASDLENAEDKCGGELSVEITSQSLSGILEQIPNPDARYLADTLFDAG
jgi:hypothetical protein